MSKYAKRCCSEVNENIPERIFIFAADACRARAVASSFRPRSNSNSARLSRPSAVSGCSGAKTFYRIRSASFRSGSAFTYSPMLQ